VGGGALPEFNIESSAIQLKPCSMKIVDFERALRKLDTPVIGRIENDCFLLDMRTIQDREVGQLAALLLQLFEGE